MDEKEQMLTAVLNCRRVDLLINSNPLTDEQKHLLAQMQERRESGEPLQYVIGHCDFMGQRIFVDKRVLIPRPETEILVELAISKLKRISVKRPLRILDLGTGSGNIAITLASHFPKAQITALDISKEAIELAKFNAKTNHVSKRIKFIWSDMIPFLEIEEVIRDKFDMIISNPPYVKTANIEKLPQDVQREPRIALDGGEDGLKFYKKIITNARHFLTQEGFLLFEIGEDLTQDIMAFFKGFPSFQNISVLKDYVRQDRIIVAQLTHREAILN